MVEAINDGVVTQPVEVKRYLSLIQQESEHLGQLIEDLFELSRIESGTLELHLTPIPLSELVMETVDGLQIQARERGVHLEARCDGAAPDQMLDGPRIQRVLVNLIQNAIRHTPRDGEVCVEVAYRDGGIRVAVSDTGEGITAEDQKHVFDRFFRGERSRSRESGGTGLGLAIARGIVEAHRGTIRVQSSPGQGARFVVTL
jgi:two-component system sensor histidine kinase ResE